MVKMELLSKRLMNTGGKKVYGHLKADVKAIVNDIVDELAKEKLVEECYEKWLESQQEIIGPVITLVIHFGAEEWDGPLSLHEMMATRDMEILSFVENYRIHLIDPAKLTEEELDKFSTSLKEVMGYIKYSKDKEKLLEFLRTDTRKTIEMNAARVIKMITNTPIEVSEEMEEIEMCKAIDDLILESESRGRMEGEKKGEAKGEAKGMIEICLEMNFSKEDILRKLQDKLNISI